MSVKSSPSIVPRFSGKHGRRNLLLALCSQTVVSGNLKLAEKIARAGCLQEAQAGELLIEQGGSDNDVYFIISGSASVLVNRREVAIRGAGTHVGEIALLDPTARRSATVIAQEQSLMLKLSEPIATRIAAEFPEFWRRIALELSSRLRERAKFIREPNSVPQVFIGSSGEALNEAACLNDSLARKGFTCFL